MSKRRFLAVFVIIISASIGLTPLIIEKTSVTKTKVTFNSNVTVENANKSGNMTSLGVNPSTNLHFGRLTTNANYTKWIQISTADYSRVEVNTRGNISQVLDYEETVYMKGSNRIPIHLVSRKTGYFEGKIILNIDTAQNSVGRYYIRSGLSELY